MVSILEEYDIKKQRYESFAKTLRSLIESLIISDDFKTHSISARVKNRDSLEEKIIKKGNYSEINYVTDIVGIRIITHFSNEVDLIAKIIEREFEIDKENSIDKGATLEPDRFGYLSLHYVVSLNESRRFLKEYLPYSNFKAEIQIRTILQHTWAEIEHDIGYKSSLEIPKHIKRRLSRLAGLLEIADDEFSNIKESLFTYASSVSADIQSSDKNKTIELDKVSYIEYLKVSPTVLSLSKRVSEETHTKMEMKFSDEIPAIKQLKYHGINTIHQLDIELDRLKEKVIKRATHIVNLHKKLFNRITFTPEIFGVFLAQALSAESGKPEDVVNFINSTSKMKPRSISKNAEELIKFYNS